jgi:hypothetical protein
MDMKKNAGVDPWESIALPPLRQDPVHFGCVEDALAGFPINLLDALIFEFKWVLLWNRLNDPLGTLDLPKCDIDPDILQHVRHLTKESKTKSLLLATGTPVQLRQASRVSVLPRF